MKMAFWLDYLLIMGICRITNNIYKRYSKPCHIQMHATVDHSHTGLIKEVDSQTRESLRKQYFKVGKEKPHSSKSHIA